MTRYSAQVKAMFVVEFDDDGELDLKDQAHDAASLIVDSSVVDIVICDVEKITDE